MIPKRILISLYIIFTFIFLLSCQKKTKFIVEPTDTKTEVKKLIVIADQFYDTKEFDSAFFYYNKVKLICNPITDSENYVSTLNDMADIQQNQEDFIGSETTVTEALPYLKYVKKPKHAWNTYVILGTNYLNTSDLKNALLYYNKALNLNTSEWRKLAAKNNIAAVLMQEKRYVEALQIFLSLITKKSVIDVPENHAKALDNIGFCYYKIDNPEAITYLEKALKIRSEINNDTEIGISYLHLAKFYQNKNSSLTKKFAKLSYQKASLVNHPQDRMSALELLIKSTSDNELKKYSTMYVNLVDSIFEVRQKAKNQFARIKYDSKIEKDENLKLKTHKAENELQLERQKNRNIVSYIIIALSLSLVLVLYFYLTSRGKKEKIEATYKSETRIAKKLHDELANDIYHTMAFAENKNLALTENREQLLNNLDAIYSRTRDISKENNPIITNENYLLYLKEMISGFNTPNINIILNGLDSISWCKIDRNKKITIYRVIQELLVNMKKHSNATLVGITFKTTEKNILINYIDNGKGVNIFNITFKNGLHNVESRILNINGEIDIDSAPEKGFKVYLKFPL
ncbi:ATP-binding protein [Flavobacterium sp. FlaQc-57]|uniref:tetratricopeptide repeat-containing sensor histidine kinase n=1 Tax=Flavobacterium sp. FlaQc-57 TaxID=3374186 RepID=UPI00375771F1